MLEGLRRGTVDAILVTSAKYKALVPEMELLSLPLLLATEDHWQQVLSGSPGQRLGISPTNAGGKWSWAI